MSKTIFGTSDKSNFIVNMNEEQYSKVASGVLLSAFFLVPLFTIPPEVSKGATFEMVAVGLLTAGFFAMIAALIAVMKKFIDKKVLFPVCAFGAMVLWGFVSMFDSYDLKIGFYGFTGRGEGMLAIIFYLCFFLTALTIKREKAVTTLINGAVAVGLLNSLFALVQITTGKLTTFEKFTSRVDADLAVGLSQTPIFLAMVLTLSLAAAGIGFAASKSRRRSIFCLVSACIFSFVMIYTYSLVGICGIVLGVITAFISVFVLKAKKIKLLSSAAIAASAALAVVLSVCGAIGNINTYKLYDGYSLWRLDSYCRLTSSGIDDKRAVDIFDTADTYAFLNKKTSDIISEHKLTGTGPEQLVYPQIYNTSGYSSMDISDVIMNNKGTFDKVYNEYLYTAATRGIPSLIALAALLLYLIVSGFRTLKKERTEAKFGPYMIMLCGVLIFFIGCSNIVFSPIFWTFAGLSAATFPKKAESGNKGSKKKNKVKIK